MKISRLFNRSDSKEHHNEGDNPKKQDTIHDAESLFFYALYQVGPFYQKQEIIDSHASLVNEDFVKLLLTESQRFMERNEPDSANEWLKLAKHCCKYLPKDSVLRKECDESLTIEERIRQESDIFLLLEQIVDSNLKSQQHSQILEMLKKEIETLIAHGFMKQVNAKYYLGWSKNGHGIEFYIDNNGIRHCEIIDRAYYYNQIAEEYCNVGIDYSNAGQYKEAISFFQKASELNPNNPLYHLNMGLVYAELVTEHHIEFYEKAKTEFEEARKLNDSNIDKYYYTLGKKCKDAEYYEGAIESLNHALKLQPNDYSYYTTLGGVYLAIAKYVEAIKMYQMANQIEPNNPIKSEVYFNIGAAYFHINQYDEAFVNYQNAVIHGQPFAHMFTGLIYEKAYENYRQAYIEYQSAFENCVDSIIKIEAKANMLVLLSSLPLLTIKEIDTDIRQYLTDAVRKQIQNVHHLTNHQIECEALRYYQLRQISLLDSQSIPQSSLNSPITRTGLPKFNYKNENLTMAKVFKDLFVVTYNILTESSMSLKQVFQNLPNLLINKSVEEYKEVINEYDSRGLTLQSADIKIELAMLFTHFNISNQSALKLYDEALSVFSGNRYNQQRADILYLKMEPFTKLNRPDEAYKCFNEAMTIAKRYEDITLQYQLHAAMAEVYIKESNIEVAIQCLKSSIMIEETVRAIQMENEYSRAYFGSVVDLYNRLIHLYLSNKNSTKELLECIERINSRTLIEHLKIRVPPPPHLMSIYQEFQSVKMELKQLQIQFQTEISYSSYTELLESFIRDQKALREKLHSCQKQIESDEKGQEFVSLVWGDLLSADDMIQFLHKQYPDKAVVEYYYSPEHNDCFALVISPDRDPECVPLLSENDSVKDILKLVREFRYNLVPHESMKDEHEQVMYSMELENRFQESIPDVMEISGQLYKKLFEPIREIINVNKVIIIGHGELYNLNFNALYDGNSYLAEQYEISYAPSISTLIYASKIQPIPNAKPMVIGHPVGNVGISLTNACKFTDHLCEVYHTKPHIAINATKESLIKYGPLSSSIWFISHGSPREITLCEPNASGDPEIDVLSDQDITDFQLDLNVDLVANLSCGVGYTYFDPQEYELSGISMAFLHSGARTFLGPIWNIDVEASVEFLKVFVDHYHQHGSKTSALQYAQKSLINHNNSSYRHPYFWAGFRLTGVPD